MFIRSRLLWQLPSYKLKKLIFFFIFEPCVCVVELDAYRIIFYVNLFVQCKSIYSIRPVCDVSLYYANRICYVNIFMRFETYAMLIFYVNRAICDVNHFMRCINLSDSKRMWCEFLYAMRTVCDVNLFMRCEPYAMWILCCDPYAMFFLTIYRATEIISIHFYDTRTHVHFNKCAHNF